MSDGHSVTSVRPTKDGQWEVVATNKTEESKWRIQWAIWWEAHGEELKAENPDWWREE